MMDGMGQSGMMRNVEAPSESAGALVKDWQDKIIQAKKHWDKDFKRMRRNMDFANGKQWPDQAEDDDRYTANFVQRVIKTLVSALYAKNPTVVARRRRRLDYAIWDGKPESMAMAMQAAMPQMDQATGMVMPADPNAVALMQDIITNQQRAQMLDKVGATLEVLIEYFMSEQTPRFKQQMKQMIRRARTTGVGYIELGFQRQMDLSDDQSTRIADMTERLAVIGQLSADLQDGELDPMSAEAEQLRLSIQAIESEPEMIVREGLIFTFPQSTRIIPSPETMELVGWVGSPWIAKEILLTRERIKQVYRVDIGDQYTSYKQEAGKPWGGNSERRKGQAGKGLACVWHVFDRDTGLEYVLCDGHPAFLREPASPDVQVEQFFPIWPLVFNEVESEEELFPKSDVELLKHIQREYNRAKEALRQHRIANRPLYLAPEGQFDEGDAKSLASHAAHDVVIVKAMRDGVKPQDLIAPVQKIGVDPNLYETESAFMDMVRVVGAQQAQIGGTAGGTATESTIAAQSYSGSIALDSDDLDEMLTDVMRAAGQVLLLNMTPGQVTAIVGPGAAWPELTRLEVMQEIGMEIKAGSSGRPQAAEEAATFERLYPLLIQLPGVSPRWLAERAIRIADDDIRLEDAYVDGLPSIMAQNRAMQASTGNPATDPNAQGDEGEENTERPDQGGPDSQPGFNTGPQPNQM